MQNHVAALLYALEEFVRLGLREEDSLSPTSKLCRWNRPRARTVSAQPIVDVRLGKHVFTKRIKRKAPKPIFLPVPPNKRLVDPTEIAAFRRDLHAAHEDALTKIHLGQ